MSAQVKSGQVRAVTSHVIHVMSIQIRSGQVRSRQGQVRSDKVMLVQVKIRLRSSHVKVRRGQVISSSKFDQIRTSHGPAKVR